MQSPFSYYLQILRKLIYMSNLVKTKSSKKLMSPRQNQISENLQKEAFKTTLKSFYVIYKDGAADYP